MDLLQILKWILLNWKENWPTEQLSFIKHFPYAWHLPRVWMNNLNQQYMLQLFLFKTVKKFDQHHTANMLEVGFEVKQSDSRVLFTQFLIWYHKYP